MQSVVTLPDRPLAGLRDGRPRAVDVRALGHGDALPRRPRPPRARRPTPPPTSPPGESYSIENDGPGPLVALVVDAPTPADADTPALGSRKFTVNFATQPDEEAGIGRTFRLLVDPAVGCAGFTQFMGEIPVGRAPDHSHTYDEVVYVVAGEGFLHMAGETRPIRAGSCIYLPPLHMHCLENAGDGPMRVLGVFQPAGSPAARYAEEA